MQKILRIVEIEATTRAEAQLMDSTISLDGLVAEWEHQEDGRRWCYVDGSWKDQDKFIEQG